MGRCPVGWEEVSWGRTSLEEWRDPEWEGTVRTLREHIVFQAECWSRVGPKCCLSHDLGTGLPHPAYHAAESRAVSSVDVTLCGSRPCPSHLATATNHSSLPGTLQV